MISAFQADSPGSTPGECIFLNIIFLFNSKLFFKLIHIFIDKQEYKYLTKI